VSDIGFPGLERAVYAFFVLCTLGPPLLIGLLLLLVGFFVRNCRRVLTALYFGLSVIVVCSIFLWCSARLNDSDIFMLSLPLGIFGTVFIYGLFILFRWIWKGLFAKRLAKKSSME